MNIQARIDGMSTGEKIALCVGIPLVLAGISLLIYNFATSDGPEDLAWRMCQSSVEAEAKYGSIEFGDYTNN